MNFFYHPCMDAEIKIMERNDNKAREQVAEIRAIAKELKCSAKYVKEAHD